MLRYIPYALGVIVLTGATWWQAKIVDRWGMSSISEVELQARFAKVPLNIGPWKGVDYAVKDEITEAAGAVAHVNRVYTNEETGEEVVLWLIVGHAKDIVRHTPDICYRAQGYRQQADEVQHTMATSDNSEAVFWTARFTPEAEASAGQQRVFWAWSIDPEEGEDPKWVAPAIGARRYFGNTTGLFKMYFYTNVKSREETKESSPCVDFARICIPEVNAALFAKASDEAAAGTPGQTQAAAEPQASAL